MGPWVQPGDQAEKMLEIMANTQYNLAENKQNNGLYNADNEG